MHMDPSIKRRLQYASLIYILTVDNFKETEAQDYNCLKVAWLVKLALFNTATCYKFKFLNCPTIISFMC